MKSKNENVNNAIETVVNWAIRREQARNVIEPIQEPKFQTKRKWLNTPWDELPEWVKNSRIAYAQKEIQKNTDITTILKLFTHFFILQSPVC